MAEPLHRSRDDRMLAGVAAGVAETLDADPSLVRIVWALLAILTGGIAVLVYPRGCRRSLRCPPGGVVPPNRETTAFAPPPPAAPSSGATPSWGVSATPPPYQTRSEWRASRRAARRARRHQALDSGEAGLIFGVVLVLIGALFLARQAIPWFDFHVWWPVAIIGLGVLLLLAAMRPRRPTE